MNDDDTAFRGGTRLFTIALALAALGVIGLVLGAIVAPREALAAYLTAFVYVTTIALGALVFLMIVHAMRAVWPTLLRRLVEGMTGVFPILAVLFIPIPFGLRSLYPWTRPESIHDEAERAVVELKLSYLNSGGFIARAVLYFVVWIGVSYLLRRSSAMQDRDPGFDARRRMHVISAVLLPVVAIALSLASVDWVMSLMPAWYSTMFPVYFFAGGFLGAIALLTVMTTAADRTGAILGINASHYYALGRLLLAFVIFWAYVAFFQFMLMWIANRPEEAVFYVARAHGGWRGMTIVMVFMSFALPFFVLLDYGIKRRRAPLTAMAVWLLVAHYLDVHWLVMPTVRPRGFPLHWVDLAALLAVAGITVVFAVLRLRGRALVPVNDPRLPGAIQYESL
ncbi:Hypothetical protein A7982_01672 [Minicystis rosea]|nr:Hypothetical protein A7982_01672 [Minicystis rosea]